MSPTNYSAIAAADAIELDIEALYDAYAAAVSRVIQRLVGHGPQVDDLLQETFIVAFKKRHTFTPDGSARSWLYGIASNLCRRHLRNTQRFTLFRSRLAQQPEPAQQTHPDNQIAQQQTTQLVFELLSGLSPVHREVFVLYELEDLEGEEIAQILSVPVGTIWTRLHHARKHFRRLARRRLATEVLR